MASVLKDRIFKFLDQSCRTSHVWGQSDCMLDLADWVDLACRTQIAVDWRGKYSNESEAIELLGGDFQRGIEKEIDGRGLSRTGDAVPGDIAIVTVSGQDKPLGAIMMPSGRWRMRTALGFVMARDVVVITAWRLPTCQS